MYNRKNKRFAKLLIALLAIGGVGVNVSYAQKVDGQDKRVVKSVTLDPSVLGMEKNQAAQIKMRMASKQDYDNAGLPYDARLSKLGTERVLKDDGRIEFRLISTENVNGLSALVIIESPSGQMFREETLGAGSRKAQEDARPVEKKASVNVEKKPEAELGHATVKEEKPKESSGSPVKGKLARGSQYKVVSGDTLRGIAGRIEGVSQAEVLRWAHAIWLSNLPAFVKGHPERIMLGETITLPDGSSLGDPEISKKEMIEGERTGKVPASALSSGKVNEGQEAKKTPIKEEMAKAIPEVAEKAHEIQPVKAGEKANAKSKTAPEKTADEKKKDGKPSVERSKAKEEEWDPSKEGLRQLEKEKKTADPLAMPMSGTSDTELQEAKEEAKKARQEVEQLKELISKMKKQEGTGEAKGKEPNKESETKPQIKEETNASPAVAEGEPKSEVKPEMKKPAEPKKVPPKAKPLPAPAQVPPVETEMLASPLLIGGGVGALALLGLGAAVVIRAKKKKLIDEEEDTDIGPLSVPTSPIFQPTAVVKFDASDAEIGSWAEDGMSEAKGPVEPLAPVVQPSAPLPTKEEVEKAWEERSDVNVPNMNGSNNFEDLGAMVANVVDSRQATQSVAFQENHESEESLDFVIDPEAPVLEEAPVQSNSFQFEESKIATLEFDLPSDIPEVTLGFHQAESVDSSASVVESKAETGDQAVTTMLELASAYWEIGDRSGAEELLQEILAKGDHEQKNKALELMGKFSPAE